MVAENKKEGEIQTAPQFYLFTVRDIEIANVCPEIPGLFFIFEVY